MYRYETVKFSDEYKTKLSHSVEEQRYYIIKIPWKYQLHKILILCFGEKPLSSII